MARLDLRSWRIFDRNKNIRSFSRQNTTDSEKIVTERTHLEEQKETQLPSIDSHELLDRD